MAEKIDTLHPDYVANLARWKKNRHFSEGQQAVKGQTTIYLPQREMETASAYNERLAATNFFNATGRTLTGYLGALFRKEPTWEGDSTIKEYWEDVSNRGESLPVFSRHLAEEMVKVNRGGVLIDVPTEDEQKKGARSAYLAFYEAEQIINWKTKRVNGEEQAVLVVLKEEIEDPFQQDPIFGQEMVTQYRVLRLVDGVYEVTLYSQKSANTQIIQVGDTINPTMGGKQMEYIPFVPFSSSGVTWDVERPPLDDLVELNHGHYLNSSQYEHVLKFAGNPMLFVKDPGADEVPEIILGSSRAYFSKSEAADARFIELKGDSIPSIKEAMADKEKRMAVLGARLLEEQPKDSEAAETVRLRQSGEGGILGNISQALSEIIEECLRILIQWDYRLDKVNVRILFNRDFVSSRLSSQDLAALISAWQSGGISHETLLKQLMRGEILEDGTTIEEELNKIDIEGLGTFRNKTEDSEDQEDEEKDEDEDEDEKEE